MTIQGGNIFLLTVGANGGNTITLNNLGAGAQIALNAGSANTLAAPIIIGDTSGLTIAANGGVSRTQIITGGITGAGNLTINDNRTRGNQFAIQYHNRCHL